MKFTARVKPGSRLDEIEREGNNLTIKTRAPAWDGKANAAVIKLLADYFGVAKSSITIKSGLTSKNKIIDIEGL
jgi:uncharacterized protein (TIGR00251 family)